MDSKISNEDIFDWVMGFEDECMKRVRDEVILTAEYNYGEQGRKVAEKYYKAIDGEEPLDDIKDKDCDDCKERAKRMLEKAEFLRKISEVLYDDTVSEILKMTKINDDELSECLDTIVKEIMMNLCFKIDDTETKNKIKTAVLLSFCKKLQTK